MHLPGRPDWKSIAADRLHRMGRGREAKALYGLDKTKQQKRDEQRAREWRREEKRRARGNESLFARLRKFLLG